MSRSGGWRTRCRALLPLLAAIVATTGCETARKPLEPVPVTDDTEDTHELLVDVARKTTALAAVFAAAAQVADPEQLQTLSQYGIVPPRSPAIDEVFPERRALVEAVRLWDETRKRAALAWLLENATWSTRLHAMAIESFDSKLEARDFGPSMLGYAPHIYANRASLAPLLRDALEDEAIRRIASDRVRQPEGFGHEEIQRRREAMFRYLRIDDDLPPYHAFYATLMSPGLGVNASLPDGSILFVVGPHVRTEDALLVLYHEMARPPIHRILQTPVVAAALASSECAFAHVGENFGYVTWRSYFAETLVRALSYRLQGAGPQPSPFIYEVSVGQTLMAYEQGELGFEEVVLAMLDGFREYVCAEDARGPIACPAPAIRLPSGTCLFLPGRAASDVPVAIYLHGMTEFPSLARLEGLRFVQAAGDRIAVLLPLGTRGECAWSQENERQLCWPTMPDRVDAVQALAASLRDDLEAARARLGRDEEISSFLVGFSNGAYGVDRIAGITEMPIAGLAILHGGGERLPGRDGGAVPIFLCAARDDRWHFSTMETLRAELDAAGWPVEWREHEGGHALAEDDPEEVVDFILRAARERSGETP